MFSDGVVMTDKKRVIECVSVMRMTTHHSVHACRAMQCSAWSLPAWAQGRANIDAKTNQWQRSKVSPANLEADDVRFLCKSLAQKGLAMAGRRKTKRFAHTSTTAHMYVVHTPSNLAEIYI